MTIVTGVFALGAVGVGTFFGLRALVDKRDFDNQPTTERADRAERDALLSDACFGLAIALGITTVVMLVSGADAASGRTTARGWAPSFQF